MVGSASIQEHHVVLRDLRRRFGCSQRELARAAGIDQGLISRLEAGKESHLSTYVRLVEAMGGVLLPRIALPVPWPEAIETRIEERHALWLEAEEARALRRRSR